jgi:flagellar biosynthesis/type III secretory pathway M-ring protein FliF/YscJ
LFLLIIVQNTNKGLIQEKEPLNMMVVVAGGFLVLVIAIVIMCILMTNTQRKRAKKAAENAERLPKSAKDDTVSICCPMTGTWERAGGQPLPPSISESL